MNDGFDRTMKQIVKSIKEAGYDPYAQIKGYLATDRDCFITRTGNARSLICGLEKEQIERYIQDKLTR